MLLKDTLQYMWGISRARKDYLNSLRAGDEFYEAEMAGVSALFAFLTIILFSILNYFVKISFLTSKDPKLAEQFTSIFGFPWLSIAASLILYILILLIFGLTVPLSAYILGQKQNIIRSLIAFTLASSVIALLFITPSIFYLLSMVPQLIILVLIWPIVLLLWLLRVLHRIATQVLQMDFSRASVFIFIIIALTFVILLLTWLLLPTFTL